MTKVSVYNMEGSVVGEMELSEQIFGIEPNEAVVHLVAKQQLANRRQGTAKVKTRSERRGGGRKPYRQKGTGRARQGSIRAAQWVGGGRIFGPAPRDYSYNVPKKVRRLALKSVLADKAQSGALLAIEGWAFDEIKTKSMAEFIAKLPVEGRVLLVTGDHDKKAVLSARNLPMVDTCQVATLNVLDILKADAFIASKEVLEKVQEVYAG